MKNIKLSLMGGGGISFLNRISQALFVLMHLFNTNQLFAQQWCTNDGSDQCSGCMDVLSDPNNNIGSEQQFPRVLYVDKLVTFRCEELDSTTCQIKNNWFLIDEARTILGFHQKEHKLFRYAIDAGFTSIILYNVPKLLRRGFDHKYNRDNNRLYPAQELERFIFLAKEMYGLEVAVAAPESDIKRMYSNIESFYDLSAYGNLINNFGTLLPCGVGWQSVTNGGSVSGGYFRIGDLPTYYEIDDSDPNDLKYHPFDHAVIDVVNTMYHKYRSTLDFGQWWGDISNLIMIENEEYMLQEPDKIGCFREYLPFQQGNIGPEKCFQGVYCNSYSRVVTEYEFWIYEKAPIPASNKHSTDVNRNIFDIEESYEQYKELVAMVQCMKDHLKLEHYQPQEIVIHPPSDDGSEDPIYLDPEPIISERCPFFIDTYIMQLASSSLFYNGQENSGNKNYVFGSNWLPQNGVYPTIRSYDFDAINRTMADEIDELVDRIYLATYRQTPCHLWSDDIVEFSQSYRRRFKDVYAYFSGNNIGKLTGNKTEIFPLFSARHDLIVNSNVFLEDIGGRAHLGLFLTHFNPIVGPPPLAPPFHRSIGLMENTFEFFASQSTPPPFAGCDNSGHTLSPLVYGAFNAPTSFSTITLNSGTQSTPLTAGQIVELNNVVQGESYKIEVFTYVSPNVLNNNQDRVTVYDPSGNVVHFGKEPILFTANANGTYQIHLTRNSGNDDCVKNTGFSNERSMDIEHLPTAFYHYHDPNPNPISFYDNVRNGYAWYRYSELGGINTLTGNPIYKNDPKTPTNISSPNFIQDEFKVYPNPNQNGLINLGKEFKGTFFLNDLTGRLIYTGNVNSNSFQLNTSELSGIYILNFVSETENHSVKLIISKP